MKKQDSYTLILSKNNSPHFKQITVSKRGMKISLALFGSSFLLLLFFLTNYFNLQVDYWRLSQLEQENKEMEKQFAFVKNQMEDLEKRVYQISDFSRKIQLITNRPPDQSPAKTSFGQIYSSSAITALSVGHHSPQRKLSSLNSEPAPSLKKKERDFDSLDFSDSRELEVRIERLKERSELVKQNTWTLYTDLLEKQEILNNTPTILPVKGWVSSHFGYRNETIYSDHEPHFHRGMDIASTEGNPVMASGDGKVIYTGYDEFGYGNLIVIDHGYGLKSYYAHLAEIQTKRGQLVQRGDRIASVGSTGKSTGPHLHYEIRIFGKPVNPNNYILDQNIY